MYRQIHSLRFLRPYGASLDKLTDDYPRYCRILSILNAVTPDSGAVTSLQIGTLNGDCPRRRASFGLWMSDQSPLRRTDFEHRLARRWTARQRLRLRLSVTKTCNHDAIEPFVSTEQRLCPYRRQPIRRRYRYETVQTTKQSPANG